jgi:hypothetical protein
MLKTEGVTLASLRERLLRASRRGYIGLVREVLTEKRVTTNRIVLGEALHVACAHGHVAVVTELLLRGTQRH